MKNTILFERNGWFQGNFENNYYVTNKIIF